MAGIDDVLERLITDEPFRAQLVSDPDGALKGYDLTEEDRGLLASQLSVDAGRAGGVEARTSKAGLFGLLGGLDEAADALLGGGDAPQAADGHDEWIDVSSVDVGGGAGSSAEYEYPGEYASRFDGVTPSVPGDQAAYQNDFAVIPDSAPSQPGEAADGGGLRADDGQDPPPEEATYLQYKLDNVQIVSTSPPTPEAGAEPGIEAVAAEPTGDTAMAPGGGTMSTDDWEEPAAAPVTDGGADEKITIHGTFDMPATGERNGALDARLAGTPPSVEDQGAWPLKWEVPELDPTTPGVNDAPDEAAAEPPDRDA